MNKPEVFSSCEDCCFEENLDCKLDKLKLFENNGAVLEIENDHILIKGRQCNSKRDKVWLEKHGEDYLTQLKIESDIKYGVIINASNVSNLSDSLDYLASQTIKPNGYYIIYNNENIDRQGKNVETLLNNTGRPWKLKIPMDKYSHKEQYVIPNEYINNSTVKEPFILYIRDQNLPKKTLIQEINQCLNIELKQIMMFADFDYIFVPTMLAKMFGLDNVQTAIIDGGHEDKICRI